MIFSLSALVLSVILVTAGAHKTVFPEGEQYSYQLSNDVFIKDFKNGRPVAYRLVGMLNVANILTANDAKLLKFTLNSPQLHVRPHKSDSQTEFNYHKSPIDNYQNNDFYAIWTAGNVSDMYFDANENVALTNIKKSIVSLFQYKTAEGVYNEHHASGHCKVRYTETSHTAIRRMKQNCVLATPTMRIVRPEQPLQASVQNYRSTDYEFFADGQIIRKIESRDYFHIALEANREIGGIVDSIIVLNTDGHIASVAKIDDKTPKEFLSQLNGYKAERLESSQLNVDAPLDSNIKRAIKEYEGSLAASSIGTVQSAKAFLNILPVARVAKEEDFVAVLQAKKFAEIKPQILDILGAASTLEAHAAVKKVIDFKIEADVDDTERYLQALAISARPNADIILDLLNIVDDKSIAEKVKATIIHTLGSMARRFAHSPNHNYTSDVVVKVRSYFNETIAKCGEESCCVQFLNGMNNLQSVELIEQLFEYVNNTDRAISVAAMKALRSYPISVWNKKHFQQFEDIFYQKEKRFDSSVRTLALDILLASTFTEQQLQNLLSHLKAKDNAFEVKKYLFETVHMLASENAILNKQVQRIIKNDTGLNNYHIIGQKGLTTALSRKYSVRSPFNGTLTSIQEIFGGILKRGVVDLTIDSPNSKYSYFTLGLYSGGLSSFVSSNTDSNDDADVFDESQNESANAGMEITIQGAYLRPLQFFSGQAELMGHVWSGTASEVTPAYTANTLLHDHHESLQLQNGASVYIDVESALSIDLNGAIQLSLWGRNAQIQVNQNVGLFVAGKILVNAGFVTLDLKFNLEKEPKLNLNTDVDFSSENILCMQLSQPDDLFRYEMEKNQKIPDIRHHVKSIKKFKYNIVGITHYLNEKNNEMCNKIFAT